MTPPPYQPSPLSLPSKIGNCSGVLQAFQKMDEGAIVGPNGKVKEEAQAKRGQKKRIYKFFNVFLLF
jgi:antitoxin component YwqK of YwqJK toxin-antitoxin module